MPADDRHRRARVEAQGLERGELVQVRRCQRAKVERCAERDSSLRHAVRGTDVEHLHALPLVEALREVGGRDERVGRVRHSLSVVAVVQKRNGRTRRCGLPFCRRPGIL